MLGTDVVQARGDDLIHVLPDAIEEAPLVEHALWSAFAAGAVVGQQHDDRVVQLLGTLEEIEQTTDLCVGVVQHRSEGFLQSRSELLLVDTQLIPRPHARIARCERGVRWHDAHLLLARKHPLPLDVPTFVELAAPLVQI